MAYCLRLSKDVAAQIDDMRRHWLDFDGGRAAGGTPSAREFRQYAWQFWPEGIGNSGEQGVWQFDPECCDAEDVARFSYAAWVDDLDKYDCDPPWMRYPRSR